MNSSLSFIFLLTNFGIEIEVSILMFSFRICVERTRFGVSKA
jgi:hypothetical protein